MRRVMVALVLASLGCDKKEKSPQRAAPSSSASIVQTLPTASKSKEIVQAAEPFARELKNVTRALDIGIEPGDFNARVIKLAEAFEAVQDVAKDSKEGNGVLVWGSSVVEDFQTAAKSWTEARNQRNDIQRVLGLDIRDIWLRAAMKSADEFWDQLNQLKQQN